MADVMLRFDMRQPDFATASQADLYQSAIAMCAWGDANGIGSVHLSEHHGSPDNYCPSPLMLAAAMAAVVVPAQIVAQHLEGLNVRDPF